MLAALRASAREGDTARGAAIDADSDRLWRHAAAVANRLPAPTPGSMVTFAFGHDRGAFAAALLGTWMAGHGAALPENDRRDTVLPVMSRPEHAEFLHDTGIGRGLDVSKLLAAAPDGDVVVDRQIETDRVLLELHSGCSDGSVQIERWTGPQLLLAIDGIVEALKLSHDTIVVHAFTPTYRPAVLAGLLAPLRAGSSLVLDHLSSLPQLVAASRRYGASVALLSARQAHLASNWPPEDLVGLEQIGYCSDLATPATRNLSERLGMTVTSVADDRTDPVAVCVHRLLQLTSIDDVAVACLPQRRVLVVPVGAHATLAEIQPIVEAEFGTDMAIVVRASPRLSRGPNDRIAFGDLCARAGLGRDGFPIVRELQWRAESAAGSGNHRFHTRIPERYAFFEGHFHGYPVLAGGVQLQELILPCVRSAAPQLGALRKLEAIKFLARIEPGDDLVVAVLVAASTANRDGDRVTFEVLRGSTRCTSGRLSFLPLEATQSESS